MHEYRSGKIKDFFGEVYKDWILPTLSSELANEKEFFAELSLKEIQMVARNLAQKAVNRKMINLILNKKGIMTPEEQEAFSFTFQDQFKRQGNERFLKILQDEFRGKKLAVKFNIAGRQANLAQNVDKIVNVIRQVVAAPQMLENPGIADLFNQIIEFSGLNPIDFTSFAPVKPASTAPLQEISKKALASV